MVGSKVLIASYLDLETAVAARDGVVSQPYLAAQHARSALVIASSQWDNPQHLPRIMSQRTAAVGVVRA